MTGKTRIVVWIGALAVMFVASQGYWQQVRSAAPAAESEKEAAPADASQASDAASEKKKAPTLGEIIFGSDWLGLSFYAVLAGFSIVATTATLERCVALRRSVILPAEFVKRLRELLVRREDSPDNLRTLCEANPSTAANILRAGVLRSGQPLPEIEKALEDAAARESASLRARIKILRVCGNIAPQVGLLGTVVGMIIAFRVASQIGTGKAEHLAEGIYVALLTTAGGLMISVPCLVLAAWFDSIVDRYLREVDECVMETLPSFARHGGKDKP